MKQKKLFFVLGTVGIILIIVSVIIFVNFNNNEKQDVVDIVEDDSIQIEKNVSGIAEYAISDEELQFKSQVEYREVEGGQKECVVVEIEGADMWNQLTQERQTEIMEGLINTSRLQIDREFGCVVIEYGDVRIIEGFWRTTGGYVIIQK